MKHVMHHIVRAAILPTILAHLAGCGADGTPVSETQRFRAPAAMVTPDFVERTGFNPDHRKEPGAVYGYLSDQELQSLPHHLRDALEPAPEEPITAAMREGYHDYDALTAELQRLVDQYPDLIRLETAGQSVQGREIWYVVMSDNVQVEEAEPKFIYHANMHGDEVVGRELMIYLIRHMAANHGSDARITQILDNSQLFVMPSMNPDGYELGRRSNSRGYDLNRNFPDRFDSPRDVPQGRQIEVQHMMRLAEENHFVYGMNWHGGEICFNLPWGNISNRRDEDKYGDDAMFYPIGREYTELNRPMYDNHYRNFDHGLTYGYEWYPVNGGINDWFNGYRRSVHAVVELSRTKWPSSRYLAGFWDDNREAMITYLWRGMRGVHLEVVSQDGELVMNPEIAVDTSRRTVRFDTGIVDRLTGDGPQVVTISAPGYQSKTLETVASYFAGERIRVVLDAE